MLKITPANSPEHIKTIETLAQKIWNEHYSRILDQEQICYMLDKFQSFDSISEQIQNRYEYYFLEYNDILAGYFSFKREQRFLFISKIYIDSNFQKQGIGRKVIDFCMESAKKANLNKIQLAVNKNNSNAIKAYEKYGFTVIDAVINDIGNGFVMDDYVLEKQI